MNWNSRGTLQQRGTNYERNSFKRIVALVKDTDMQKRWKYFLKNIKNKTLLIIHVDRQCVLLSFSRLQHLLFYINAVN